MSTPTPVPTQYPVMPVASNGGYPNPGYANTAYPENQFPIIDTFGASAPSFVRERDYAPSRPQSPQMAGQAYLPFAPSQFGTIDAQLGDGDGNGYAEIVGPDSVTPSWVEYEGVNPKDVDHWNLHPGDVNLDVGYWEAMTGTPRQAPLAASVGPVTGRPLGNYSGYVAQLRQIQVGAPGPVKGRINADAAQAVRSANSQAQYAYDLVNEAISGAVFGAL